jgi:hypothetical protein
VNGLGKGYASANVSSAGGTSGPQSPQNYQSPGAATPPNGYTFNQSLPPLASGSSYAYAQGLPGLVYHKGAQAGGTDSADNLELQNHVVIHAASCASLTMDSTQNSFDPNTGSGSIAVITTGTAGTALWLRGFEYTGDLSLLPPYDPSSAVNAPVEYLKANGAVWKFETLIVGPFQYTASCPLIIFFNLDSKDTKNLIFVADSAAIGSQATVPVLPDVKGECPVTVSTAPTATTSCGVVVTGSTKDPLLYHSAGTYTVHWTFDNGSLEADQKVIVTDTTPPVVTLNGSSSMTVECHTSFKDPGASATDTCAGVLPVIVTGSVNPNAVGTYTLTYSATDGTQSASVGRTVQVVDTTAPTITCPSPISAGGCTSGTGTVVTFTPTVTDTCDASPTVVCTPLSGSTFPAGTTTVNCTATDHAGNTSTCSFPVTVSGLTFSGFQSPINGIGGCPTQPSQPGQPLLVSNLGNKIPVKFQVFCNGVSVSTGGPNGTPKIDIYKVDASCANPSFVTEGVFQVVSSLWHFNWLTGSLSQNQGPGYYHLIVTLQDGTTRDALIQLR